MQSDTGFVYIVWFLHTFSDRDFFGVFRSLYAAKAACEKMYMGRLAFEDKSNGLFTSWEATLDNGGIWRVLQVPLNEMRHVW